MRQIHPLFLAAAIGFSGIGFGTVAAHAQGTTYPSYYGNTPSPSFYHLPNQYDRDTYMNPNPFPSYQPRRYEEPPFAGAAYPPSPYAPATAPDGFYRYYSAYPTLGYYYGPGPYVYGHYGRAGRMAFRYGWW
jgi:hypothetical protein